MSNHSAPLFIAETDEVGGISAVWVRADPKRTPRVLDQPRMVLESLDMGEFVGADRAAFRSWAKRMMRAR